MRLDTLLALLSGLLLILVIYIYDDKLIRFFLHLNFITGFALFLHAIEITILAILISNIKLLHKKIDVQESITLHKVAEMFRNLIKMLKKSGFMF